MSWSKQVTLWCDTEDCPNLDTFRGNKVSKAREEAENQGWNTSTGGPDHCPTCERNKEVKEKLKEHVEENKEEYVRMGTID